MSEDNEMTNHQPEVFRIPDSALCIRLGLKHVQPPKRYDTYRIGIFEMTIHDSSWNFGWLSIKWAKTKIDSKSGSTTSILRLMNFCVKWMRLHES
jgi:hypothetical protein